MAARATRHVAHRPLAELRIGHGYPFPPMPAKPSPQKQSRVKLKPADSFDLIRLLARSQSDPRKAVCELVQNSLDAGARRIEITWLNDKGARVLKVLDDGAGVFPELPRDEA